jgi:predicted RNase H-like HicB family nuclease
LKPLTFQIVIEKEAAPGAGYSCFCPAIPGCFSNGPTIEEAKENMRAAVGSHLKAMSQRNEVLPLEGEGYWVDKLSFLLPN